MYAIAKTAGVPVALTKVALNRICANNLLDCTFDDYSDEYWYVIHKDFYDEATALYSVEELEALQRRKSIPASDRFVALDHNLPALVEAKQAVESLSKAISSSNSLFANAEERIQVSEELNFLGLGFERGLLTESWDVWIKSATPAILQVTVMTKPKPRKLPQFLSILPLRHAGFSTRWRRGRPNDWETRRSRGSSAYRAGNSGELRPARCVGLGLWLARAGASETSVGPGPRHRRRPAAYLVGNIVARRSF